MNIYISSSITEDLNEAIKIANSLNVNLEISRFGDVSNIDNNFEEKLEYFSNALRNFSGNLSLHGFFQDLNPSSSDAKVKEISQHRYNQSFLVAKKLRAKTIVFHTGYNSLIKHHIYHKNFLADQITFWKEFIKKFEDAGIVAVLENTLEYTPDVILTILNEVNSENLKACIDTGHVNINSPLSVTEWIERFGKNLYHMHLHNNFGQHDDHNSLINGLLDFRQIISTLKDNNLNPNLALEIFSPEATMESIEFLKKQNVLTGSKS